MPAAVSRAAPPLLATWTASARSGHATRSTTCANEGSQSTSTARSRIATSTVAVMPATLVTTRTPRRPHGIYGAFVVGGTRGWRAERGPGGMRTRPGVAADARRRAGAQLRPDAVVHRRLRAGAGPTFARERAIR